MPTHLPGRYVAAALLLGGLACAGNKAPNENAEMAKDTTQIQDSAAYKAMERDTTANTSKSSGIEHADTNQGSAPNSTSQNPPTQMSTDSAASSGFVRADTTSRRPRIRLPSPRPAQTRRVDGRRTRGNEVRLQRKHSELIGTRNQRQRG